MKSYLLKAVALGAVIALSDVHAMQTAARQAGENEQIQALEEEHVSAENNAGGVVAATFSGSLTWETLFNTFRNSTIDNTVPFYFNMADTNFITTVERKAPGMTFGFQFGTKIDSSYVAIQNLAMINRGDVFFKTNSYGTFRLGNNSGVESTMTGGTDNITLGSGMMNGNWSNLLNTNPYNVLVSPNIYSGGLMSTKLTYQTPKFGNMLQIGLSYTPDQSQMGGQMYYSDRSRVTNTGKLPTYDIHSIAWGVNLGKEFKNGFSFNISHTGITGQSINNKDFPSIASIKGDLEKAGGLNGKSVIYPTLYSARKALMGQPLTTSELANSDVQEILKKIDSDVDTTSVNALANYFKKADWNKEYHNTLAVEVGVNLGYTWGQAVHKSIDLAYTYINNLMSGVEKKWTPAAVTGDLGSYAVKDSTFNENGGQFHTAAVKYTHGHWAFALGGMYTLKGVKQIAKDSTYYVQPDATKTGDTGEMTTTDVVNANTSMMMVSGAVEWTPLKEGGLRVYLGYDHALSMKTSPELIDEQGTDYGRFPSEEKGGVLSLGIGTTF